MKPTIQQAEALLLTILEDSQSLKENEFVAFDGLNFGRFYVHPNQQSSPYIKRRGLLNPSKSNIIDVIQGPWMLYKKLTIKTTDLKSVFGEDRQESQLAVFYFQVEEQ